MKQEAKQAQTVTLAVKCINSKDVLSIVKNHLFLLVFSFC